MSDQWKSEIDDLRRKAEEKASVESQLTTENITSLTPEQIMDTIHDLRVHQIELEMQNEELRTTQIALDDARIRYFDLFDLAPVGYLTISETGIIKECNLTASTLLCFNRNEITGKPISQFILQSNQDIYYLHSKNIFKTLVPNSFEIQMKRKDRTSIWLRFMMTVSMSESEDRKCMAAFIDITELKKAEEEKEKLNERITQIKMQKLESLGLIAGGIAHDFNNLLSGIFSNIELANAANSEKIVEKYLINSLKNIDRARGLTQKLLTFSKGGDPIKEKANLFPFVRETVLFALSGSNVSSQFHIEENLWPCYFDKNQIGQVIDNLIINAWQSMPDGGVIEISARNISLSPKEHKALSNGDYVLISIKDHGSGIPEELQSIVFDPYYTTKFMGHGLGLSICYSIINRHGGCINIESEPGKGSTFDVYLPACKECLSTQALKSEAEHRGSGTFIVMDDEDMINQAMKGLLESFGYEVVTKENGEDVIDFLAEQIKENHKLAGMILDLTIPGGMGGREAIFEIRKIDPDLPVFISSGYSEDPVMSHPEKFGFTASIRKPFKMTEFTEMLENYMS